MFRMVCCVCPRSVPGEFILTLVLPNLLFFRRSGRRHTVVTRCTVELATLHIQTHTYPVDIATRITCSFPSSPSVNLSDLLSDITSTPSTVIFIGGISDAPVFEHPAWASTVE